MDNCLQCDERLNGPRFAAIVGRTGRRSGIETLIKWPPNIMELNGDGELLAEAIDYGLDLDLDHLL